MPRKSWWCVVAARRARACGMRRTPFSSASRNVFATAWIESVTSRPAGPPCGGLYLKPPSRGGLCEGVTTMPSACVPTPPRLCLTMACEMAGVGVYALPAASTTSTPLAASTSSALVACGCRQRMRVDTHEQRAGDALTASVVAYGLRDGEHMPFVEREVKRRAAVARRPKGHPLGLHGGVGTFKKIRPHELVDVDEHASGRRLAGKRTDMSAHAETPDRIFLKVLPGCVSRGVFLSRCRPPRIDGMRPWTAGERGFGEYRVASTTARATS